jgi:hypothetical protein
MLQVYVLNISSILDVLLQLFHLSVAKVDPDVNMKEVQALGGLAAAAPLVWRRWRTRTRERHGLDVAAGRSGWGAG